MVPITTRHYRKRHVTDESNDNNADNEESVNTTQEGDLEAKRNENRKCFGCQKTMGQITQYCTKCWNKRKTLMQKRSHYKKKRKSKLTNVQTNKPKVFESSSENSTDLCMVCLVNPKIQASFIQNWVTQCAVTLVRKNSGRKIQTVQFATEKLKGLLKSYFHKTALTKYFL